MTSSKSGWAWSATARLAAPWDRLREAGLQRIASYDKYAFDGPYSALIQARAAAAGVTLVGSPEQLVEAAI